MNTNSYRCVSIGLGFFMLIMMITALHLSLEGENCKTLQPGIGDNEEEWIPHPVIHKLPLMYYLNVMIAIRRNKKDTKVFGEIMENVEEEFKNRVVARCMLMIGEAHLVVIAVLVVARRISATSKSTMDVVACGLAALGCAVCGTVEAWFASGEAMDIFDDEKVYQISTDGWIAASAFLFLGVILWAFNAILALLNPVRDEKSFGGGYRDPHLHSTGHPQGYFYPHVGHSSEMNQSESDQ